jgi:uncharacterized membrane protein
MIGGATWIVWLHLLAMAAWLGGGGAILLAILPSVGEDRGQKEGAVARAANRAHFFTSRAMEAAIVTGFLNIGMRVMASGTGFSRAFLAMLSLKIVLVLVMAGLQVWMGIQWRRAGDGGPRVGRIRGALAAQLLLGMVVALLGLGVRAL